MRILHTADWHLGSRLGQFDRTEELFRQVERICELCKTHEVDLLLVAGDIFDCKTAQLPAITRQLADILAPYVREGLEVLLVPGNHDHREHFRMMRSLITCEQEHSKRIHVFQKQEILTIKGVQFAVLPYPSKAALLPDRPDITGKTRRHVSMSARYADYVQAMKARLVPSKPAVFVGHILVAGVTTPSNHEIKLSSDLRLGREDLPNSESLAYIALGHIHQPQAIPHVVPCHYSGSIERMNWGEYQDQKTVLLVDIPPAGPAEVTPLPLETTPFYDIEVASSEIEKLPEQYPDLEKAFVRVTLQCQSGDDALALQRRVREICPRCTEVRIAGELAPAISLERPDQPRDFATTALEYLRKLYAEDPDLPELEKRAQLLIQEADHAITSH